MPLPTKRHGYNILSAILVFAAIFGIGHAQYNQFFGASNYFGVGGMANQGSYWHHQTRCPWGSSGYRNPSSYQCGTFSCPTMWFGTTSYNCPMGTLYSYLPLTTFHNNSLKVLYPFLLPSNSLQTCVSPAVLAGACRRRAG